MIPHAEFMGLPAVFAAGLFLPLTLNPEPGTQKSRSAFLLFFSFSHNPFDILKQGWGVVDNTVFDGPFNPAAAD